MGSSHKLTDQLRQVIQASGQTRYSIWKQTGVTQDILSRFMTGERGMSLETADKLFEHFEIKLVTPTKKRSK
ncbi:MAG: helix-turn-helix transcriptional regulator [Pirellulales bacterium]|nr:helix-turn-helix transcriptional regulator [Pirellulales bacterium]